MTRTRKIARMAGAVAWLALAALPVACASGDEPVDGGVAIDYERYRLANGLDVILHVDRSDPIAAVAMTFHVGSAREVDGRTGFAHLFEHLFFLDSEDLGPGGLDRLMTRIGSATNGSTSNDRTNYYEVVPIDGLEKALWAEADKLGFFINTVSESVVAKERQVVKNEKRQSVDNQPYGHTEYVIDRALYPDGHPYRWQVIGSLEDLDGASLSDVVDFHRRWYGPNNATLVVAGDIDVARTMAWVERYFAEIPARDTPPAPMPPAVALDGTVSLFHEDNYARLPMLTMAWPTVPLYHPDQYALDVLSSLLTDGKATPFYTVLVEEAEVAPDVSAFQSNMELAGRWTLSVRTYEGVDLDAAAAAIGDAFARFEAEGVRPEELERVKAGYETDFYRGLSSVLGKAFQLAQYAIFADDPGFAGEDLTRYLGVTGADLMRVYETYIRGRPHVVTSFVPKGEVTLALDGATRAEVVEEPIVLGAEEELGTIARGAARTPSAIDRSVEPPFGDPPMLTAPDVWRATLDNGLPVLGIEDREVPVVQFRLRVEGGQLLEAPGRTGVANLLAESLLAGTARKTPEELEQAIDLLGASIDVSAGARSFLISGSTLARNYDATMALVQEILFEPRFDADEFEISRQQVINQLRQSSASPVAVAGDVFQRLVYGDHVLAENRLGEADTVAGIGLDDLRAYYARALRPGLAALHVAGAVSPADAVAPLGRLSTEWTGEAPSLPPAPVWDPGRAGLYVVDVPGASQSVLAIGYLALAETDADFFPATVMNFRLGGGGFASDLLQVLREERGYTYGISSGFSGTRMPGPFQIRSSVRSNVTLEALEEIKRIVEHHGRDFDDADLETTQGFLLRVNAGAFESGGDKLGLLADMSLLGFPADYVLQREQIVRDMTVPRARELAGRYLDPAGMIWLVVGDARTQLPLLRALGLGEPVLLDREGRRVTR